MPSKNTVKSDETLLAIIESIQDLENPGVTALANHLDMAKSSIHKHLKTLEKNRYVINDRGHYRLSLKFLSHGEFVRDQMDLCQYAWPKVRELAEETDSFIMFAVKEYSKGVFAYVFNDRLGIRQTSPLGQRFHLHSNASGKAILARLSDEKIEDVIEDVGLPAVTANTITSREELFVEIEDIREEGYATSFQERVDGARSIASSVHNPETGTIGSISLTSPHNPSQRKFREDIENRITEAARELELEVQYKPKTT